MKTSLAIALVALLGPVVAAWTLPCVPAGESVTMEFDRPPIDSDGIPTSAHWSGAEVWDKDGVTGNDNMGEMTADPKAPEHFTAEVTNDGGTMVGPNGADVEGGLKGDCVEVYAVFYYRYQSNSTGCVTAGAVFGGVSMEVSRCEGTRVWRTGWVRVGYANPTRVCPC